MKSHTASNIANKLWQYYIAKTIQNNNNANNVTVTSQKYE